MADSLLSRSSSIVVLMLTAPFWMGVVMADGATSEYESIGKVANLPQRPVLDIAMPGVAARVAKERSYKGEIIMFTSDAKFAGWGFHWVKQLRSRGYEHWMILSDGKANCRGMHKKWNAVQAASGDAPLSCVYSSYPRKHPGWDQWAGRRGTDAIHDVYILWATRWWVAISLLRNGVNVLSLDVDAVMLGDIYAHLRSPPLAQQDVIITRNDDGSQSLNCGFVYFNRNAAAAADETQRAEVAQHCGGSAAAPASSSAVAVGQGETGQGAVPAAEWVCELMWERLRLFLEIDKEGLRVPPQREVLWEQDAWNDLVKSIELKRRVFPWVVGYGKDSDLWRKLGYERRVTDWHHHPEKWVAWQKLKLPSMPRAVPPDEPPFAERFFKVHLRVPLLWLPLCPLPNASSRAAVPIADGTTEGIPLGLESPRPLAHGRLMVSPAWLASLGNDPESDWAGARPSPLTYVHITNMWKCFPHPCWSKAGRLFWLRAHGFWDRQLDDLGLTPRGAPFTDSTTVLALPAAAFDAVEQLGEQTRKLKSWPKPHARNLGWRKLHALVHNLVTVAGLIGRKPVLPHVPCDFVRAVQSPEQPNRKRSRFGVCHAAVVATGSAEKTTCQLAPGTWRPGGPDQCYQNAVMFGFDFGRFVQLPSVRAASNGSLHVRGPPVTLSTRQNPARIPLSCSPALLLSSSPPLLLSS